MPVIQGADLTSVSTEREPYPNGEYKVTIKSSEMSEDNRQIIIKMRIDEPAEFAANNREYWDYINLVQNDGKQNRFGLEQVKRYLEAVFGKGSPEAEASPPDTDVLDGHSVTLQLEINEYWSKEDQKIPEAQRDPANKKRNNKVKRIFPA